MALQKKQKFIIIGAVAAVVLVGIGIGSYFGRTSDTIEGAAGIKDLKKDSQAQLAASGKKVITVKTNTQKNCSSTPWVVAEKKGFFAAEGLNVEYTGELKSEQILPSILNGTNNVSSAHPNTLASYIAGGAKVRAVTLDEVDPKDGIDPKFRHMRFYASPKLGVKNLKELVDLKKGQKIKVNGTAPVCTTFIAATAFEKLGFDRNQIQFVSFDSDTAAVQAAQQGNLDIVGVHPPFYKLAADSNLPQLFDSHDTGYGEAAGTAVYYFTDKFIEENPEAVQRFVTAIKKAQAWANANTEESIKLTADYIGQPVNATHYYYTGSGLPEKLIQPWIDDLVVNGALKKDQLKVGDIVTTKFDN